MDNPKLISVQVRRGDKNESELVAYEVPVEDGQSVLGVLQYIYDHLDPSIGFTCSCRIGLCSSCLVRVNGKEVSVAWQPEPTGQLAEVKEPGPPKAEGSARAFL